jgi:hypothetical protein
MEVYLAVGGKSGFFYRFANKDWPAAKQME